MVGERSGSGSGRRSGSVVGGRGAVGVGGWPDVCRAGVVIDTDRRRRSWVQCRAEGPSRGAGPRRCLSGCMFGSGSPLRVLGGPLRGVRRALSGERSSGVKTVETERRRTGQEGESEVRSGQVRSGEMKFEVR